ncbi:protein DETOXIFICATION 44, chloroplastic-like isoform X1 [Apium graveolens]|uniref:protein DETOXIFICATION 44, chloroplastic-like isoform X1 n=1 Tax=Apium graveolens TaxID=4045 RepID=UPI003D7B9BD4
MKHKLRLIPSAAIHLFNLPLSSTHTDSLALLALATMLTGDIPPNQTIYIKNLNEKVKKEGAGNLLNVLLDPVLIFLLGLGIGGAAISTVISEYVDDVVLDCLYPFVETINDKVSLISPKFEATKFFQYLKSDSTVVPQVLSLD